MKYIIFIVIIFNSLSLVAQSNAKDYIERYKNIALQQMIETDIPASILLGQGILESSVGTSILATKANNHFGMTCNTGWEGQTLYKLKNGEPTCYKVYNSPAESYIDHAKTLARNPQFENLFFIEAKNYKRWAKGLEALEYSQSTDYADQLIQIIELYKLYEIDKQIDVFQEQNPANVENDEPVYHPNEEIYYNNGVKAVLAREQETPLELAARMKIPLRELLTYNDISLSQNFYSGQFVYLAPKRAKFHGDKEIHLVSAADNVYLIAQQYGIKMNKLLNMNRLKLGEEVQIGEKIYLRSKAPQKPLLRMPNFMPIVVPDIENIEEALPPPPIKIITPPSTKPTPPVIIDNTEGTTSVPTTPEKDKKIVYVYPDETAYYNGNPSEITEETVPNKNITPVETLPMRPTKPVLTEQTVPQGVHVVEKGETLYSISKKYNVTVQRIKDLNGLFSNEIELNQQLKIQ